MRMLRISEVLVKWSPTIAADRRLPHIALENQSLEKTVQPTPIEQIANRNHSQSFAITC